MADTRASYQAYVRELKQRIAKLEAIRGQVPETLLDEARTALAQGDGCRADSLFARIETKIQAAIQAAVLTTQANISIAAKVAYQRSQIAKDEVRYRPAYEHARWAVRLAPDNSRYRSGSGELAWILKAASPQVGNRVRATGRSPLHFGLVESSK